MSPVGWEHQALDSIQSALGHTDPRLASLLATFTRLASSEEMPAHEKVRSPLRQPPRRRRSRLRRGKAPYRHRSPQRAVILTWLITSIAMITVAVILSRGGQASCPQAFWNLRRLAPQAAARTRGPRPSRRRREATGCGMTRPLDK
jgi:hypothetical protein